LADGSMIQCPLCGNKVPAGVSKCPVCSTKLDDAKGGSSRRASRADAQRQDFLHRELPKTVLPESVHLCPLCALKLEGKEAKCPRCGVPLAQLTRPEDEMLECPECGALAKLGSKVCPKCGVGFEEEEPVAPTPPVQELPPPPMPKRPEHVPERPLPEITPVVASPAPMTTNQGLVNGRGAVNGTGLINGTGMVNGSKGASGLSRENRQKSFVRRWQFLAILVAIVVIVPTFIFLSYSDEPSPFAVDGDFHEWSGVEAFSAQVTSGSDSIDLSEWAVQLEPEGLFLYLMTEGALWDSSEVTSFFMFIDSDNSPTTGYLVSDVGADYLVEFSGWNSTVQSATASQYIAVSGDRLDWNSWRALGSINAVSGGKQLEAMAGMLTSVTATSRFLLVSQDSLEQNSISYAVPAQGGLLVIRQEPGPAIGSDGVMAQSAGSAFIRLRLTCDGADGTLNSISPGFANVPIIADFEDVDLSIGVEEVIDVMVDTTAVSVGSMVYADLARAVIGSTFADVEIIGDGVSAYVGAAPATIVIDGAFGDWSGKTTSDSDSIPNINPDIDIADVGAVNDTDATYFYVGVLGGMCDGHYVPVIRQIPSGGGGGGGGFPPRTTGEDIMNIYIDTDLSSATGYPISLASKVIGAEYKMEIRGANGNIVARSLMQYVGGLWNYGSETIDVEKDSTRLEAGISASSIGGATSIDFIVEMTDWRSRTDMATSVPQGTRALVGGLAGAGIDSWLVDGATTSSQATAMSYQRKLFFDGTNLWSFFFDGTNTLYKYSTNGGATWTAGGRAFSTGGVNEASLWYDQSNNQVYIIGDTASASTGVMIRNGTVSPSSHTITWAGNDYVNTVSTNILGGKNTYITRDSSGYIWFLTTNQTSVTPSRYDLSAFRSRTVDSIGSFFWTGNMVDNFNQMTLKGSIVNVGTGSDMLVVMTYQGFVVARVYSGSTWGAPTTIYDIGTGNAQNTENAPPSVVVDGKGVAHIVYGNGHEQALLSKPFIYYAYYNGAWSASSRLDSVGNRFGNVYPTISLDRATGNVYAFWIETNTDGVGVKLMGKKNTMGTWTFLSLTSDITYPKQYLTSIYSAPSESWICWQWTQNTTGTLEVQLDMIPEFKDVAAPVFVMMCVFIVIQRTRVRGRKSSE